MGRSVLNVGPQMASNHDLISTEALLYIDDWISFETNAQTLKFVDFLKQQIHKLFIQRIESLSAQNQNNRSSDCNDAIIESVVKLLDIEEVKSGFTEGEGLRLRPERRQTSMGATFAPKYQVMF